MSLQSWRGARFVGLYICFPISSSTRKTEILAELLKLEKSFTFNTMEFGRLSKRFRESRFTESQLPQIFRSLETGDADWLQLYSKRSDSDWVRAQETQVHLSWKSSIVELRRRPPSPIDKRFGNVGSVDVTYPVTRFQVDSESPFQTETMKLVKALTSQYATYWAFIHEGFRPKRPASVGEDDIFQETRKKYPLTSFDSDLHSSAIFFKEFVKGAFWSNFLNPFHVEQLGGIQRIRRECPASVINEIGDHVLLQIGPSPIAKDHESAVHDYQVFRKYLGPILMETPEERTKFQVDVLGSWRPPGFDKNWNPISPAGQDR